MHERGQFGLDFPSCSPWKQHIIKSRSSHQRCSLIVKKLVFKNFTKLTEKHLCLSLFFYRPRPATLLKSPVDTRHRFNFNKKSYDIVRRRINVKTTSCIYGKRLWHKGFPVNFAIFFRKPFLQNTSGRMLVQEVSLSIYRV